ncbi:MAG: type II secretion system protein [Planctomycetota bacterium]
MYHTVAVRVNLNRRAFSVLELLVAIAIVAILTAITLPSLSVVRGSVRAAQSAQNLRTCAAGIALYTDAHRSYFPHFADFQAQNAFVAAGSPRPYASQSFYWPMVVHPYIATSPQLIFESIHPPGVAQEHRRMAENIGTEIMPTDSSSTYWMGWGFFTTNNLWKDDRPSQAHDDPGYFASRRIDEVRSPSGKGILIESIAKGGSPYSSDQTRTSHALTSNSSTDRRFLATFVDGSVESLRPSDFTTGQRRSVTSTWSDPKPVLETRLGLAGVDR